jgi:hypothetical protein
MAVPEVAMTGRDVVFTIKSDGRKVGELHVSQGDLTWRPSRTSRTEYKVPWAQFDAWMRESGAKRQTASRRRAGAKE